MLRVSPFKLAIFRHCPRQYYWHYVKALGPLYAKPRPYYTMGDHVHGVLQALFRLPPAERGHQDIEDLLRCQWQRNRAGFRDEIDEARWFARALAQLNRFAQATDLSRSPFLLEATHEIPLAPRISLLGRIDRVDLENGGLHIIDYKTGKMPALDDRLQLEIYALILSRSLGKPVKKASYVYLDSGQAWTARISEKDTQRVQGYVLSVAEDILREKEFPRRTGPQCHRCDFQTLCGAPEKK